MQAPYGGTWNREGLEAALNEDTGRKTKLSPGPSDSPADPPFVVDGKEVAVKGDLDAAIVVE